MTADKFTIEALDADRETDRQAWDALVDQSPSGDVYYRPGYVMAYRDDRVRSIRALVVDAAGFRCLIPLLVSDAGPMQYGPRTVAVHAYSAYGYGGLLPLNSVSTPTCEQVAALRQALQFWCHKSGAISIALRTHPMFDQDSWLHLMECNDVIWLKSTQTTSIDLMAWNEEADCAKSLRSRRRSYLNYARRHLQLTWSCGWNEGTIEELRLFQAIYERRMRSLGADPFFYFSDTYYSALASGLAHRFAIGLAWRDGQPVGGALFMAGTHFAHYHLGACDQLGLELKAATLLINAGASWARNCGCARLHLGGGHDSLFRFKQSFGGDVSTYGIVAVIADRKAFDTLCEMPEIGWPFAMHRSASPDDTSESSTPLGDA